MPLPRTVGLSSAALAEVGRFPDRSLCVACSGGADSVSLVHLLAALPALRPRLVVLHYDHRAGRNTSARDRDFVRTLAAQLQLPCEIAVREENGGKIPSETGLRALRLQWFRRCMARHRTHYLLTAHHRDDALETLLLRLARGGNLESLTAPREVQHFRDGSVHLRPLLHLAKAQLVHFLRKNGWTWCEDETNALPCHSRNRVRNQLIPLWRSFEPERNWERSLHRCRQLLDEDHEALSAWAKRIYARATENNVLHMPPLRGEPVAIRRRVIHLYFTERKLSVGAASLDKLLAAIGENKSLRITLPGGVDCHLDRTVLTLASPLDRPDQTVL
jgi:tRNA(Ile)-lysidine synthetase-like protein